MTVTKSFIDWLEFEGVATFGQDLFASKVPDSKLTPAEVYWVIINGGFSVGRNKTGEMLKQYSFLVFYRSTRAEDVDEKLSDLEELINCKSCFALEGYEVLSVETSAFTSDSDTDEEDRESGFLQVDIQTYKQRC